MALKFKEAQSPKVKRKDCSLSGLKVDCRNFKLGRKFNLIYMLFKFLDDIDNFFYMYYNLCYEI